MTNIYIVEKGEFELVQIHLFFVCFYNISCNRCNNSVVEVEKLKLDILLVDIYGKN